jgi:D-alanyl-D-alanine carboxypeptidase
VPPGSDRTVQTPTPPPVEPPGAPPRDRRPPIQPGPPKPAEALGTKPGDRTTTPDTKPGERPIWFDSSKTRPPTERPPRPDAPSARTTWPVPPATTPPTERPKPADRTTPPETKPDAPGTKPGTKPADRTTRPDSPTRPPTGPRAPEKPGEPARPEALQRPAERVRPDAPEKPRPGSLTRPPVERPTPPGERARPEAPDKPDSLTRPPTGPRAPGKPGEPARPEALQRPAERVRPDAPEKPATRPDSPTGPRAPEKPTEPARPEVFRRPEVPGRPAERVRPDAPEKPRPGSLTRPPRKPGEPERPEALEKPAERPEAPGTKPETKPAERPTRPDSLTRPPAERAPEKRDTKPDVKPDVKPGTKPDAKPDTKAGPIWAAPVEGLAAPPEAPDKPDKKAAEPKWPDAPSETKPPGAPKVDGPARPDSTETKPETKPDTKPDTKPEETKRDEPKWPSDGQDDSGTKLDEPRWPDTDTPDAPEDGWPSGPDTKPPKQDRGSRPRPVGPDTDGGRHAVRPPGDTRGPARPSDPTERGRPGGTPDRSRPGGGTSARPSGPTPRPGGPADRSRPGGPGGPGGPAGPSGLTRPGDQPGRPEPGARPGDQRPGDQRRGTRPPHGRPDAPGRPGPRSPGAPPRTPPRGPGAPPGAPPRYGPPGYRGEATQFLRPGSPRNVHDETTQFLQLPKVWPPEARPQPNRGRLAEPIPKPREEVRPKKVKKVRARRRKPLLLTGIAVGVVIAVAAGVVFAVPGLSAKLGLTSADAAAVAPPAPPVDFQPGLRAPGTDAPAPTPNGVRAALSGPTSVGGLGTLTGVVLDPMTKRTLWDSNPTNPLVPASTGKLLTASAALLSLDHTEQFTTRVVQGDQPGDVIIVGGGDPTLSSLKPGVESVYPGAAHLTDLVDQVKKSGAQIDTVHVDLGRYTGDSMAPGWSNEDIGAGYIAPMVPAMLDGGREDAREQDGRRDANPARQLAQAFADRLGASVAEDADTKAPKGAKVLGEVKSAPLVELVDNMLQASDNVLAEAVAREVAKHAGEEVSFAGATKATMDILRANDFDTTGVTMHDGSGLSTEDRVPARLFGDLLAVAAAADGKDKRTAKLRPLIGALPVAGGSGTLDKRFNEAGGEGRGWVRAKTGTLSGVNSLAGVVLDSDNRLLVFALMTNGGGATKEVRNKLDVVAATLRGCGCR